MTWLTRCSVRIKWAVHEVPGVTSQVWQVRLLLAHSLSFHISYGPVPLPWWRAAHIRGTMECQTQQYEINPNSSYALTTDHVCSEIHHHIPLLCAIYHHNEGNDSLPRSVRPGLGCLYVSSYIRIGVLLHQPRPQGRFWCNCATSVVAVRETRIYGLTRRRMQWLPETDLGMKETRNLSNSL